MKGNGEEMGKQNKTRKRRVGTCGYTIKATSAGVSLHLQHQPLSGVCQGDHAYHHPLSLTPQALLLTYLNLSSLYSGGSRA